MKILLIIFSSIVSLWAFSFSGKDFQNLKNPNDSVRAITQKKFDELKEAFSYEYDEFTKSGTYTNRQFESYPFNQMNNIYCQVEHDGKIVLCSQYFSTSWLFHDKISVLINDTVYDSSSTDGMSGKSFRTASGGGVEEKNKYWGLKDLEIIQRIVKAGPDSKIKIRFQGKDFYKQITLRKNCFYALRASLKLSGYLKELSTK